MYLITNYISAFSLSICAHILVLGAILGSNNHSTSSNPNVAITIDIIEHNKKSDENTVSKETTKDNLTQEDSKQTDPIQAIPNELVINNENKIIPTPRSLKKTTLKKSVIREPPPTPLEGLEKQGIENNAALFHKEIEQRGVLSTSYKQIVIGYLSASKRYPERARKLGIEGEVIIDFEVKPDGKIINSSVLKPASSNLLNEEAKAMLERASPLPKPPEAIMKGVNLKFTVPIQFRLE